MSLSSKATKKRRFTKAQREWLKNYEAATGFEPMMDDFHAGQETFYEAARGNIHWYEMHSIDALHSIDRDIPGYNEHFDATHPVASLNTTKREGE